MFSNLTAADLMHVKGAYHENAPDGKRNRSFSYFEEISPFLKISLTSAFTILFISFYFCSLSQMFLVGTVINYINIAISQNYEWIWLMQFKIIYFITHHV